MRVKLRNELNEVGKAIAALEKFSEAVSLELGVRQAAELALDELLNNIISYAYRDSDQHNITVELSIVRNDLQIVVADDGIPFNPFEQATPDLDSPIQKRDFGGVGIHLVQKFMDECSYQRLESRNIVTLTKSLAVKEVGA